MTKIKKTLTRETGCVEYQSNKPFVVELDEKVLRIRVKGRKGFYAIRYEDLWMFGARGAAE